MIFNKLNHSYHIIIRLNLILTLIIAQYAFKAV